MDILAKAKDAAEMIAAGRKILAEVANALKDGKTAINAKTQVELDALLADERTETKAAIDKAREAIRNSRS